MSFWSSLFGGQNKTLSSAIGKAGQVGDFATGLGESASTTAVNFDKGIASGDPAQIAKLLAPAISTLQNQKQQQQKSTAEFSNRSGGTNASSATAGDKVRANLNDMVASLTGKAVGDLGNLGTSLTSTGLSGLGDSVKYSQQQMENWSNSILGLGVTQGAGFLEGLGLSKIPGAPKPA